MGTVACNSWMEKNPARRAQLERFEHLGRVFGNADTSAASEGADRLVHGGAAFWSKAGPYNDFVGRAVACANMTGDLAEGLQMMNWRRRGDAAAEELLDKLIPLGLPAARQLERAYTVLGTFRTLKSLCSREARLSHPTPSIAAE